MTDRQEAKHDSPTAVETVLNAPPTPPDSHPPPPPPPTHPPPPLAPPRPHLPAPPAHTPLLLALANAATPTAQHLAAWAAAAGDLALAAQMDLHVTDFTPTRDQDARALAVLVHEKATAHAADLADYGVEPADLADLDTRI